MTERTLDNFLNPSLQPPEVVATSTEIRDRSSLFVANIFRASTHSEAQRCVTHVRQVLHGSRPASHEMCAWRGMVLRKGKSGLGGPDDFEVKSFSEDDGEKWGGGWVLKVMESEGVLDAVVVCSRWYGGIMLGPARFTHIEVCAREVCQKFKLVEELDQLVNELREQDTKLSQLRAELAEIDKPQESTTNSTMLPDYSNLLDPPDATKARRLLNARKNAVRSVQQLLRSRRSSAMKR